MNKEIRSYNNQQTAIDKKICNLLALTIDSILTTSESKLWHAHPVWFLDGNPTVGYSKQTKGIRLMFWSGADFGEDRLHIKGATFKDASIFYNSLEQINTKDLKRWLKKSQKIQWDYKNLIKRKGVLKKITTLKTTSTHDERIAQMTVASVYPHYVTKIEKKGRTVEELHHVIEWLTGFDKKTVQKLIDKNVTFETFFQKAKLNPNADLITGMICGYRIENIENTLTRHVRYLDKLVDELAKGKKMEKILRSKKQ